MKIKPEDKDKIAVLMGLKKIETTKETYHTNDRNIRACYPNKSEDEIQKLIFNNLKNNPEYNK
jgi:lauroyl/myristoyl acyltransferase